jgi:hypothetical protein
MRPPEAARFSRGFAHPITCRSNQATWRLLKKRCSAINPDKPTPSRAIEAGSGTAAVIAATFVLPVAPLFVSRGEARRNTSLGAFVVTNENSNPAVSGTAVPLVWFAGEKVISTEPGNTIVSVSIVKPPVEIIERPVILANGVAVESTYSNVHSLAVAVGGASEKNAVVVTVVAWQGALNATLAINTAAEAR